MSPKVLKSAIFPMQSAQKTPQKCPKVPQSTNQSGALFGLDARIALAIFSWVLATSIYFKASAGSLYLDKGH
jgi:hypothetical protein